VRAVREAGDVMAAVARRVRTPIRLSDDLALPLEAITETFGIFGRKGQGKSSTAATFVEQGVAVGGRFVIADPTGVWWGLMHDGDGPGLPGIVFGGEHADVPLERTGGHVVAEFVVQQEEYPVVVLDMKLMRKADRTTFMLAFLETLYHDNREALHVVLDESWQFAPTQAREGGETIKLLGAVEDVVALGRSRGLGITMISQRFATLNANVREQIGTLVTHQLTGALDRKALKGWVEAQGDPAREKEMMDGIAKLGTGHALVWSPAFLSFFGVVDVNKPTTFDSRATPKVGQRVKKPGKRAQVDLGVLRERMAATIEEAERNDPKKLQERLRHAETKLTAALRDNAARPTHEQAEEMRREIARLNAVLESRPPETVEVSVISAEHVLELVTAVNMLRTAANPIAEALTKLVEQPHNVGATMLRGPEARPADPPRQSTKSQLQTREAALAQADGDTDGSTSKSGSSHTGRAKAHAVSDRTARPGPEAAPERGATGGASINSSEQKVLDAIAWYEALGISTPTKQQVALVASYKSVGGRFGNLLGALRSKGMVVYPGAGMVQFTPEGRSLARDASLPHDNEAVQQQVLSKLNPSQQRVLQTVIDTYPRPIEKALSAELCDYAAIGGRYGNLLGSLRSLGLVEYPEPGFVVARDVLFPVG
jgi:hypothetical protein